MFDKISTGRYWDKPWSLISGCTLCSPGCDHCWALAMERRFCKEVVYSPRVKIHIERLDIPLKRKKPTVYAVWNDLFHEDVPTKFIDAALEVMSACPQHIFLLLTKRGKRIKECLYQVTEENPCRELGGGDYLPNLWLGVTVCNQQEADEKIPILLQIPAAVRWVSIEPMLGSMDIYSHLTPYDLRGPDWVVLGGETGPGARPMQPDWVRSVRHQCQASGVPFFFKQWGHAYTLGTGKVLKPPLNRLLDGREWNELPVLLWSQNRGILRK